jgi:hypothetical protein
MIVSLATVREIALALLNVNKTLMQPTAKKLNKIASDSIEKVVTLAYRRHLRLQLLLAEMPLTAMFLVNNLVTGPVSVNEEVIAIHSHVQPPTSVEQIHAILPPQRNSTMEKAPPPQRSKHHQRVAAEDAIVTKMEMEKREMPRDGGVRKIVVKRPKRSLTTLPIEAAAKKARSRRIDRLMQVGCGMY